MKASFLALDLVPMDTPPVSWEAAPTSPCPDSWLKAVHQSLGEKYPDPPRYMAQILWQRRLCSKEQLSGFLNPSDYNPTPASAFGEDMTRAVERLKLALTRGEKVAIWGDFDADGVTATAVLWDGLGQVFPKQERLMYLIPNRLTESHGLSPGGIDRVKAWGATLIVTCDTGSTNLAEIDYARQQGLEVIVTDHHTLPAVDPAVVALINPRRLSADHPLATLSGVAVAYKLLEGFYAALDAPPPLPLENLLDLVAIGLIADLVELRDDCRYLAQVGLQRLQTHVQPNPPWPRPGVAELLTLCRRTGDRPTDISFGLGPRINAVSRIHGDASFCVELLTSQDAARCKTLAYEAELANARRKALQRDLYNQVMGRLGQMDLATTQCLVLMDEQWPVGLLGLVAGQVAQQFSRPTVLLRLDPPPGDNSPRMARGSARSVAGLDLYQLFQTQAEMITGFGGHPLAAGLTLPAENVPMLTAALNRTVREAWGGDGRIQPTLAVDLTVTVTELGQPLFRQLKQLEPYGMGNPVPKLLIRNGWCQKVFNKRIQDRGGQTVGYIKTNFELWDDSAQTGFPAEWWGHYKEELPPGRGDFVVELDHNSYSGYHIKLVAVRPALAVMLETETDLSVETLTSPILDWRQGIPAAAGETLTLHQAPVQWSDWQTWQQQAAATGSAVAVAFGAPPEATPLEIWRQLVGLAKYLARTQTPVSPLQLMDRLDLTSVSLGLGLRALSQIGFDLTKPDSPAEVFYIYPTPGLEPSSAPATEAVKTFLEGLQEEQFRRRYFAQVPVTTLAAMATREKN